MFAGEATHPHYYGTVHGAIESGFREANRIIGLYKTEDWEVVDIMTTIINVILLIVEFLVLLSL